MVYLFMIVAPIVYLIVALKIEEQKNTERLTKLVKKGHEVVAVNIFTGKGTDVTDNYR